MKNKISRVLINSYNFENWPNQDAFSIQYVYEEASEKYKIKRINSEAYIIIYLISGSLIINSGGLDLTANSGDTVLLQKNVEHLYYSAGGDHIHIIHTAFCGNMAQNIIDKLDLKNQLVYRNFDCKQKLTDIICFAHKDISLKKKIAFAYGKINEILYLMYESNIEFPQIGTYTYMGQNTVKFIKTVIDRHHDRFYTNQELANFMKTSTSTMIRQFKAEYKISPIEYQNRIKIQEIKCQLETSSLSIKQISYFTGFCAPSYFSSYFKQKMNMTPIEYRNKFRKV